MSSEHDLEVVSVRPPDVFLSRLAVWNSRRSRSRFLPIRVLRRCIWLLLGSDIAVPLCVTTRIPHPYGVIIHGAAQIGRGCTIMQQVTIGSNHRHPGVAAIIGDRVYIGAGAKIIGGVNIGNDAVVGANAVVTRDVPVGAVVVGANRIIEGGSS